MNIILSDLHLGTPRCKIYYLEKLLKELEGSYDKLILNGDILDVERLSTRWFFPQTHYNVLQYFKKINEEEKLVYIRGNHEGDVSYIDKIRLKSSYSYVSGGKLIIITHGHLLNKVRTGRLIERVLNNLLYKYQSNKLLKLIKSIYIKYMNYLPELARKKYPGGDLICIGHSHIPGIHKFKECTVYNSGDFVSNLTYLTEDNGNISLVHYPTK